MCWYVSSNLRGITPSIVIFFNFRFPIPTRTSKRRTLPSTLSNPKKKQKRRQIEFVFVGNGDDTTDGEIGGPRFDCGEVSNLEMISEYLDPDESATFFIIVAGSRSASLRAVI